MAWLLDGLMGCWMDEWMIVINDWMDQTMDE
jgi:hypothetical protein